MNKLSIVIVSVMLTGCASLVNMVPSFWDDNQSARIIDLRQAVEEITCEKGTQLADAEQVLADIQWFELYSESKGSRQQDVLRIIKPIKDTVTDWRDRSRKEEGSAAYCQAKKRILQGQTKRAAEAVLGRF